MRRLRDFLKIAGLSAMLGVAAPAFADDCTEHAAPKTALPESFSTNFELKATQLSAKVSNRLEFFKEPYSADGDTIVIGAITYFKKILRKATGEGFTIALKDGTPLTSIVIQRFGEKEQWPSFFDYNTINQYRRIFERHRIDCIEPAPIRDVMIEHFNYDDSTATNPETGAIKPLGLNSRDFFTGFFQVINEIKTKMPSTIPQDSSGIEATKVTNMIVPVHIHYRGKEYKLDVGVTRENGTYVIETDVARFDFGGIDRVSIYLNRQYELESLQLNVNRVLNPWIKRIEE